MANKNAIPSVSGTNRKWYIAVKANCKRDSSTISNIMTPCSSHEDSESEPRQKEIHTHAPIQIIRILVVVITLKEDKNDDVRLQIR